MSGSRRARVLAASIQSTLAAALALADRLDEHADRLESAPPTTPAGQPPGQAQAAPAGLPAATDLVHSQAPGLAGAGGGARAWAQVTAAGAPAGSGRRRFHPGLWRAGRVLVPDAPAGVVPLALPLLDAGNLRVTAPAARRHEAVDLVRGLLTRILAAAPPGRVEVSVYDPVELGAGLAGFAPLRAAGVVGPTLTTRAQLEATLADLSAHVGRITVDRLGGSFATLREREDAGLPRAEPWRLLVLLAWPSLPEESAKALLGLAAQGPACGVHVVAVTEPVDPDAPPTGRAPAGPLPGEVALTAVNDTDDGQADWAAGPGAGGGGRWRCSLAPGLDCLLDQPPPAELVAAVAASVAAAATDAARSPGLGALLPDRLWEHDSAGGLTVPVAFGPDGPCALTFDDDTVHGLVGGQAGAGKSTLLLAVIYGLAARYGPDQLRLHLLDFKEGLEFAQFGPRPHDPFFLPHAETVGMDSDREFGVAVLRHVRAEMARRAVAMRAAGARDLRALRAARPGGGPWPRILVVIDEFQVMLSPLDTVAREAVAHLETLARQGRAYGIHLLLASQTLSGIDALDATAGKRGSIFGQFALRVALRTSISESRVLLSTANEAAGALAGVGQAIVNRRNGHPAGNEQVQVALPDPETVGGLRAGLAAAAARRGHPPRPPRVFVGHAPAVLDDNPAFLALRGAPAPAALDAAGTAGTQPDDPTAAPLDELAEAGAAGLPGGADPLALVGVPLDLSPPAVGVRLWPQPGRNFAVLGPLRREATGVLQAAVRSVAAQLPPGGLRVDLVAASPEALAAVDELAAALRAAGHAGAVTATALTGLAAVIADAASDVTRREEAGLAGQPGGVFPTRLVVLFAADAGRAALEGPSAAGPGRRTGLDDFRLLTRRGPAVRVHLLGWWRGPSRLLDDLGPGHRDDVAAWVSVGVPGTDLFALAGHRTVVASTAGNRAVLFDRHARAEPRTVVPFAPLATRSALAGSGPAGPAGGQAAGRPSGAGTAGAARTIGVFDEPAGRG
ncbi:MAG: cell division protein FtsK [Frankia sp.]|nr:cell division protein FtsK [Frankia sp.]